MMEGLTLIPWSKESSLIWEATRTDTFAPSNVKFITNQAGKAAEDKPRRKVREYCELINQNYNFVTFVVETMGKWSSSFEELSKMSRSKFFLKQR